MLDRKELFEDVVKAVQDTTSPTVCLVWFCDNSIPNDNVFCYKHHKDFKNGRDVLEPKRRKMTPVPNATMDLFPSIYE